jgi:hypothetical protein
MVVNPVSGAAREVDVLIRGDLAGAPVTVAVEASRTARPATQPWVEQLVQKHADLGTSKLVMVSDSGFSAPAKRLAERHGAVPMTPERLADDEKILYAKTIDLLPLGADVRAEPPDGPIMEVKNAPAGLDVFASDGTFLAPLRTVCEAALQAYKPDATDVFGMRDVVDHKEGNFTSEVDATQTLIADEPAEIFLQWKDGDAVVFHQLKSFTLRGSYAIKVYELPLSIRLFGTVTAEYGQVALPNASATFVHVSVEGATPQATLRLREVPGGPFRDVRLT